MDLNFSEETTCLEDNASLHLVFPDRFHWITIKQAISDKWLKLTINNMKQPDLPIEKVPVGIDKLLLESASKQLNLRLFSTMMEGDKGGAYLF